MQLKSPEELWGHCALGYVKFVTEPLAKLGTRTAARAAATSSARNATFMGLLDSGCRGTSPDLATSLQGVRFERENDLSWHEAPRRPLPAARSRCGGVGRRLPRGELAVGHVRPEHRLRPDRRALGQADLVRRRRALTRRPADDRSGRAPSVSQRP